MPILEMPKLKKPSEYIKWCGGPQTALNNAMCFIGQCDPGFAIPAYWLEIKNLSEKALGTNRLSLQDLHKLRLENLKMRIEDQKSKTVSDLVPEAFSVKQAGTLELALEAINAS